MRCVLMLVLWMTSAAASAAEEQVLRFYGYAYDLKTNAYLYTEVHEQHAVGERWTGGSIRYFAPDGSPMGRKTLDFSANEFVPVYRLTLDYNGYNEAITAVGKNVEMTKQSDRSAKAETESVRLETAMAADSGFHSYLRTRFADLMAGKTVEFRLVVAGNLDTFSFRARKSGEGQFEGKPVVKIVAEANSLLRLVAPKLELLYEPQQRMLMEYRGLSNIHNPKTGEPYEARIAYYSTKPADAPKLPPLE